MGITIDIHEKLSKKVVDNLLKIIKDNRDKEDRNIRKICDRCIKYLSMREIYYDVAEKDIDYLNSIITDINPFYPLLLAVLNEATDEDEEAIKYFTILLRSSISENFREELTDFIAQGKFYTLTNYDELENAGLSLIERCSNNSDIVTALWNLTTYADPSDNMPVFEKLCSRAIGLYPENNGILHFQGYLKTLSLDYQAALEIFLQVKDKLEKDDKSPEYFNTLANIWNNIADCYIKLDKPQQTIESCDIALDYMMKSEDFLIENIILRKKAEALLLLNQKDLALSIITKILEENAEDAESNEILKKTKNS
jgi:tetratricopeptide (TPR) repeat protein